MDGVYNKDDFKIGMVIRYLKGMDNDLVGTINIITEITRYDVIVRRWNNLLNKHELGIFGIPILKSKLKIIKE